MLYTYEGKIGHLVNLKDGEEHCRLCCFNDCEVDCMDHVPCRMGCYYEEVEAPKSIKKLLEAAPIRMQIVYRETLGYYVGYRHDKEVVRSKKIKDVRVFLLKDIWKTAKNSIKKTKYRKNKKGKYNIVFRQTVVASRASIVEARKIAYEKIDEYFNFLIKLEEMK